MDRSLASGAECTGDGVDFRIWAPEHVNVDVVIDGSAVPMKRESDGYFSALIQTATAGSRYCFLIDGKGPFPDPTSRFQPEGTEGPSEVIDPTAFSWSDKAWQGIELRGQVIYELHVGTYTHEGTYRAAIKRLADLQNLGVTAIEIMPVANFPGDFGWGYDGVNLFAPFLGYGRPDDLRAMVNAAHSLGIAVILDIVYNHFGPSGNYLSEFSKYFINTRATEWGAGPNFDGTCSGPVRQWICDNAKYWINEFHMDGFRIDACQSIFDDSPTHIIADLTDQARAVARSHGRSIIVIAENEPQSTKLVRARHEGGYGLDALWNDDFHHSAVVALTGKREAYYTDYRGTAQELAACVKHGFLYQGQYYPWQKQRRGSSTRGILARRFIAYIENHDQVANSAGAQRLAQITHPASYRAMTALLLLGPWTPMLFQGQEYGSTRPFPYFAHNNTDQELAAKVSAGRRESLKQFPSLASTPVQRQIPEPAAASTFKAAKLDWYHVQSNALRLHRDLISLRGDPVFQAEVDCIALSDTCLAIRWYSAQGQDDRLLIVNLGADQQAGAEPLLAPPEGRAFKLMWCSEDIRYGGSGYAESVTDDRGLSLPAKTAAVFAANERRVIV
jgi:maltooligosyltrehalose trehalohydrolase